MRLTDAELNAIKERLERSTPGPWEAVPVVDSYEYVIVGDNKSEAVTAEVYERDDAIFIEYARQDMPKLVAEVERLQAEVNALERILTKKPEAQKVVVRVEKETEWSSWENFPY